MFLINYDNKTTESRSETDTSRRKHRYEGVKASSTCSGDALRVWHSGSFVGTVWVSPSRGCCFLITALVGGGEEQLQPLIRRLSAAKATVTKFGSAVFARAGSTNQGPRFCLRGGTQLRVHPRPPLLLAGEQWRAPESVRQPALPLIELLALHRFGCTSEIKSAVILGSLSPVTRTGRGFMMLSEDHCRRILIKALSAAVQIQAQRRETGRMSGAVTDRRLPPSPSPQIVENDPEPEKNSASL